MSRVTWLVAFAALSCVACSDSGSEDSRSPAPAPDETPAADDVSEGNPAERGSSYFEQGPDGVSLEVSDGAGTTSYRCDNTCTAVCTDCLFEACMAMAADPALCFRSREACSRSCNLCPEGGTASACYSPCLKGEPTCYTELGLVMPDDTKRPDVTPEGEPSMGEQTTPDEAQPSSDGRGSSSSSPGNSGRPAAER